MMYLSFFLVVVSTVSLCVSQKKNFKQVFGSALRDPVKIQLRVLGYAAFFASFVLAYLANSFVGVVYWFGLFTLVATPLAFGLPYLTKKSANLE